MAEAVFYPRISVKSNSYTIVIEKNIRDLLHLDEKIKKLKKNERLQVKVIISLLDQAKANGKQDI